STSATPVTNRPLPSRRTIMDNLSAREKATVLSALQYLKANFDDAREAMHDSNFFSPLVGEDVRPPEGADDVQRVLQQLLNAEPPGRAAQGRLRPAGRRRRPGVPGGRHPPGRPRCRRRAH